MSPPLRLASSGGALRFRAALSHCFTQAARSHPRCGCFDAGRAEHALVRERRAPLHISGTRRVRFERVYHPVGVRNGGLFREMSESLKVQIRRES